MEVWENGVCGDCGLLEENSGAYERGEPFEKKLCTTCGHEGCEACHADVCPNCHKARDE